MATGQPPPSTMPEEEFIGPQDLLESASSFIISLKEVSEQISSLRYEEASKRQLSKKVGDELSFALVNATIEISTFIGNPIDPATQKSNKDYTKLKIDKELMSHGGYQKACTAFAEAEASHIQAQVALRNAMDTFVAVRGGANIVTAMMYFLTDNRPAVLTAGDTAQ